MRGAETILIKRSTDTDWQGDPTGAGAPIELRNCQLWPRESSEADERGKVILSGWNVFIPPGQEGGAHNAALDVHRQPVAVHLGERVRFPELERVAGGAEDVARPLGQRQVLEDAGGHRDAGRSHGPRITHPGPGWIKSKAWRAGL